MKFSLYIICLLPFVLNACRGEDINSIEREELFSLDIGPMEDQIALYDLQGGGGARRVDFAMRDGLFYISDGNSGKITRYNSYGDLLFMIYSEETNPDQRRGNHVLPQRVGRGDSETGKHIGDTGDGGDDRQWGW